jgi:hypothetical protein
LSGIPDVVRVSRKHLGDEQIEFGSNLRLMVHTLALSQVTEDATKVCKSMPVHGEWLIAVAILGPKVSKVPADQNESPFSVRANVMLEITGTVICAVRDVPPPIRKPLVYSIRTSLVSRIKVVLATRKSLLYSRDMNNAIIGVYRVSSEANYNVSIVCAITNPRLANRQAPDAILNAWRTTVVGGHSIKVIVGGHSRFLRFSVHKNFCHLWCAPLHGGRRIRRPQR